MTSLTLLLAGCEAFANFDRRDIEPPDLRTPDAAFVVEVIEAGPAVRDGGFDPAQLDAALDAATDANVSSAPDAGDELPEAGALDGG